MSGDEPDLDTDYLDEMFGGDAELIGEIVAVFLDDVPPRIDELADVLDAGDLDRAGKVAHSLKGASGSLGAARLQALVSEVEASAKAGQLEASRSAMPRVRAAMTALMSRLEQEGWAA